MGVYLHGSRRVLSLCSLSQSIVVNMVNLCFCLARASWFFGRWEIMKCLIPPCRNVLYQWLFHVSMFSWLLVQFLCAGRAMFEVALYLATFCQCVFKPTVNKANCDGPLQHVSNTQHVLDCECSHCSHHGSGTVCSDCGNFWLGFRRLCHWLKIICHIFCKVPGSCLLDGQSKWLKMPLGVKVCHHTKAIWVALRGPMVPIRAKHSAFSKNSPFQCLKAAGLFLTGSFCMAAHMLSHDANCGTFCSPWSSTTANGLQSGAIQWASEFVDISDVDLLILDLNPLIWLTRCSMFSIQLIPEAWRTAVKCKFSFA